MPPYKSSSAKHAAHLALALLPALAAFGAHAQESDWRVRVGPGRVIFSDSARLSVAGSEVPGAGASFTDSTTLLAEFGLRLNHHWSANLTIGVPPRSTATGTGNAAPFGRLGEVTYGPMTLTGQYQWETGSPFRPYLGAGLAYNIVFKSSDGAIAGLDVPNSFGSVVQAGGEYRLSPRYSLFVDVKKVWLKAKANGTLPALGGAPAHADITLNPLVVQAGISVDF